MRKVNPKVKIIGEVWSDPKTVSSLFRVFFHVQFLIDQNDTEGIKSQDAMKFITPIAKWIAIYKSCGIPHEDATLLSNHDMNRIRSTMGR
jgi:hypothetical protein